MGARICFKVNMKDHDGVQDDFGIAFDLGGYELKEGVTYEQAGAAVNKQQIIDWAHLTNIITPDQMELITPEKYEELFGRDLEDGEEIEVMEE